MKYTRFEELPVWQLSSALAAEMFTWTRHTSFRGKGDLANQLQRATLSISNNIAEGYERGTSNELLAFLYYARGSAGEVRSMLCVMEQTEDFASLLSDIRALKPKFESVSRQIRGWAGSLQDSDIKGQRHLNSQSRNAYENKKRRNAFAEQQRGFMEDLEIRLKAEAVRKNDDLQGLNESNERTESQPSRISIPALKPKQI